MLSFLAFAVFVAGVAAQTFPPSIVVHPPAETVATETKTVRFTCAAYGLPLPTVKWGNENEEIVPDSDLGYQIYTQTMKFGPTTFAVSVLEISGVDAAKAGQFFCQAENGITGAGLSASFAAFSLVVDALDKEGAVLLEPPTSQVVDHGSTVEVVCVAYGNPLPTISWSRVVSCDDGQVGECTRDVTDIVYNDVATYGSNVLRKSVLQLCNVSQDDAGNYRCTAWNDIGDAQMSTDSSDWSLTVNPPTTTMEQPTATSTCTSTDIVTARESTGEDVQPYQIVIGILAVALVALIMAVVILVLLYINKSRAKASIGGGIAGDESKVDNPIYAEPSDLDDKTLID